MDTAPAPLDLDITLLRRFVAVVECGTFVAAAQKLCITQQALSTSIAKMEELAGVKFLDRKRGGRVALTIYGRRLLARAHSLIALSDQTLAEISQLRDARGGTVTVGIGETMTGRHVAAAISSFHEQQPDVQICLMEGYTEDMIRLLLRGEVDFVVGGSEHEPADSNQLHFQHLFEVRDVLVVRRDHPVADMPDVTLDELRCYPWIVPAARGDVFRQIQLAYIRAGLQPPARIIRSDAIITGTWLFLDDDYIMTASPDLVDALCSLDVVRKLPIRETTIVRHACVITRRDMRLSPPASRLLEEIVVRSESTVKRWAEGEAAPA